MDLYMDNFFKTMSWYRTISNRLIMEIPQKYMHQSISHRSLTPACQLVDLGDFHQRVVKLIDPTVRKIRRPNPERATKEQMIAYIEKCDSLLRKTLKNIKKKESYTLTWFDRMTFTFPDILSFILAHEAMHHGELMSLIYDKDLPMPKAFTETWGMC